MSNLHVEFDAEIIREPDTRENNVHLIVKPDNFSEKVLVSAPLYPKFNYGDFVHVSGKIKKPENFQNDSGIEFDYVNFLAKDGILSIVSNPKIILIKKIDDEATNFSNFHKKIFSKIFKFKQKFISALNYSIPSPASELAAGILLGSKQSLGDDLENDFRRVGLIHIIVLSGYNVTIIIEFLLGILFFLPQIYVLFVGTVSIFLFFIMVGQGATVARASIMATIALVGRSSYRVYNVNRALFLAGFFMVWINPAILFSDPSFQLSFMATWGLVNIGKRMTEFIIFCENFPKLKFIPKILTEKFSFRELFVATTSTQIAVLPLLAKMTGEVSVISLPVNLITLPFVPISMLFGFITGILGMFSNLLGMISGFFPYVLLNYIIFITRKFSSLSFATILLPEFFWPTILFYYCALIIFVYFNPIQIFKKIFYILWFTRR